MSCKYCNDTGLINDLPCIAPDCEVRKAFETTLIKYKEQEASQAIVVSDEDKPTLTETEQNRMAGAVQEIRELAIDAKENRGAFDLLRYRYKDNGLVMFIYGPKENQDKIVERLEQVIAKYKKKGVLSLSEPKYKPRKELPMPTDKGFNFRKLLGK